jgi:hypothetical protein
MASELHEYWCAILGLNQTVSPITQGAAGENRPIAWGPFWDHTLCAMLNDLRVCELPARPHYGHLLVVTCGNALPQLTGGQVVAGSNPVSPTKILPGQRRFRRDSGPPRLLPEHAIRQRQGFGGIPSQSTREAAGVRPAWQSCEPRRRPRHPPFDQECRPNSSV